MIDPMIAADELRGAEGMLARVRTSVALDPDSTIHGRMAPHFAAAEKYITDRRAEIAAAEATLTRFAGLERRMRKGTATDNECAEYERLQASMPASLDVDVAVRSLKEVSP